MRDTNDILKELIDALTPTQPKKVVTMITVFSDGSIDVKPMLNELLDRPLNPPNFVQISKVGRPVRYKGTYYKSLSLAERRTGVLRYWITRHCNEGHPDWKWA